MHVTQMYAKAMTVERQAVCKAMVPFALDCVQMPTLLDCYLAQMVDV